VGVEDSGLVGGRNNPVSGSRCGVELDGGGGA
jgi:hypothetical protein